MTTLTFIEIATIILIALGAGVMFYAAINTRQILQLKQEKRYARRWQILFILVVFFLAGYLATIALVLLGLSNILVIAAGVIFFLGALFVYLVSQVSSSTIKGHLLTDVELQNEQSKVINQSLDLERRVVQLHTAAEISRSIGGVMSPQKLLQEVADLTRERFNLYYVGVFTVDASHRYAVLQTGTGEAGQAMVSARHKLPVAESSMIGWTIIHRQARIALDVGKDAVRFANPHLPNTRSELAMPLISGDRTIGALTIQSEQPEAFDQDDIIILQNIADTLAIALENSRLFTELEANLEEVRSLHSQYLLDAWSKHGAAGEKAEFSVGVPTPTTQETNILNVPLSLREQTIGELILESETELSPDERSLIEAVATQAALALENARLLEDSQKMALHERLTADITSKVWASPNIENILQTAIRELGRALRADEATIELKSD